MADITITAAEVRQPAQGKKTGVVKDQSGKSWLVWPDKLALIQQGGTYRITDYKTSEFRGTTYYTIVQFELVGRPTASPPRIPPADGSDNVRRMDIFICGAFNNLMANPNINPAEMTMMDMIDHLHKFKGAWLGVFGPSPLPRRVQAQPNGQVPLPLNPSGPTAHQNDDMNDEIPF